jgi:hypothetical protein
MTMNPHESHIMYPEGWYLQLSFVLVRAEILDAINTPAWCVPATVAMCGKPASASSKKRELNDQGLKLSEYTHFRWTCNLNIGFYHQWIMY